MSRIGQLYQPIQAHASRGADGPNRSINRLHRLTQIDADTGEICPRQRIPCSDSVDANRWNLRNLRMPFRTLALLASLAVLLPAGPEVAEKRRPGADNPTAAVPYDSREDVPRLSCPSEESRRRRRQRACAGSGPRLALAPTDGNSRRKRRNRTAPHTVMTVPTAPARIDIRISMCSVNR